MTPRRPSPDEVEAALERFAHALAAQARGGPLFKPDGALERRLLRWIQTELSADAELDRAPDTARIYAELERRYPKLVELLWDPPKALPGVTYPMTRAEAHTLLVKGRVVARHSAFTLGVPPGAYPLPAPGPNAHQYFARHIVKVAGELLSLRQAMRRSATLPGAAPIREEWTKPPKGKRLMVKASPKTKSLIQSLNALGEPADHVAALIDALAPTGRGGVAFIRRLRDESEPPKGRGEEAMRKLPTSLRYSAWLRPDERDGRYLLYDRKRRLVRATCDTLEEIAGYINGSTSGRVPEQIIDTWQLLERASDGSLHMLSEGTAPLLALMDKALAEAKERDLYRAYEQDPERQAASTALQRMGESIWKRELYEAYENDPERKAWAELNERILREPGELLGPPPKKRKKAKKK